MAIGGIWVGVPLDYCGFKENESHKRVTRSVLSISIQCSNALYRLWFPPIKRIVRVALSQYTLLHSEIHRCM